MPTTRAHSTTRARSTNPARSTADAERAALPEFPERDARILDFERREWNHSGAKEEAIRVELGLTAARYYQRLNAVIDSPAALAHDPMLVRRLRRLRDSRRRA
ncbi:DUF3263 domain-containing protein [Salinibacterium sp. SYSU T00001]|uniref:DUF3263 domain-containing protein n=1 Tax=Homoserinimonas sedimenticola TaxID=2986805 RepID=UPI0022369B33|nr:DUF3263 domain-containing protein [Salinibacterium sedimenticola]MCW4386143.1 DUF3263 domain-containing protein [Salinibacterium sedimenticola]